MLVRFQMEDKKAFRQKELVLKVNYNYDPNLLDLGPWERFIDLLTEGRNFQSEAIKNSIIYLATQKYHSIEDLIQENYSKNTEIQSKYLSISDYFSSIQLPNKLYANIDLATGTGKSYVMYGIAQIMLGLGLVDRVLVLCPSLTIESALIEKFINLSGNEALKTSLPQNSIVKNPRIVQADVTVRSGDICIENIHAVYTTTGSSINDSFKGNGKRTLVLNDESHHIFNKTSGNNIESRSIKKWKEFLLNTDYNFKYILGFTGTAYAENEYFNDVIYRYSLREAIDDSIVKNIEYVQKDESSSINEKFQKIHQNHEFNKSKYIRIKPLTILVTKDIGKAKNLREDLVEFLIDTEKISRQIAEDKVTIVTSDPTHSINVMKLKYVDQKTSPIEWIVSVSMLTEGWDVKNVFQIVPWEDKAFNSKLLIAQVLGRGLRKPVEYFNSMPKVTVFNHDSWSKNIKELVNEVLEIETRISSDVIVAGDRSKYNFDVYNINYSREENEIDSGQSVNLVKNFSDMEEKGITLESQVVSVNKDTVYETVVGNSNTVREVSYTVKFNTWTIEEILDKIFDEFEKRDWEGRILKLKQGEYTQNNLPPRAAIREIIRRSLDNVGVSGDLVIEKNAYRIFSAFSTLLRKKEKAIVQKLVYNEPYIISTVNCQKMTTGIGNLRRGYTVFYTNDYENEIMEEGQMSVLKALIADDTLPRSAIYEKNVHIFKTPVTTVLSNLTPERSFIEHLCKNENAKIITSWIKSRDRGFYQIEYSVKYGDDKSRTRGYKRSAFNPDFFIKVDKADQTYILIVETKADSDSSVENKAKYKYAREHFERLNEILEKKGLSTKYIFHMLSPNGYPTFFEYLRNGILFEGQRKYRCELENLLEDTKDLDSDDSI